MSSNGVPLDLEIYRELAQCMDNFEKWMDIRCKGFIPNVSGLVVSNPTITSVTYTYVKELLTHISNIPTTPPTIQPISETESISTTLHAYYKLLIDKVGAAETTLVSPIIEANLDPVCLRYNTKFAEFEAKWRTGSAGSASNADFYPYKVFYYVKSKIVDAYSKERTDVGEMKNIHDFHVARLAKIVYYRMAYTICTSALTAAMAALASGNVDAIQSVGITNTILMNCALKTDNAFFIIVSSENDLHFRDHDGNQNSNSLASRYVELKKMSLNNATLSNNVQGAQNAIKSYNQTLSTAMNAELQLRKNLFWVWIWSWVWFVTFIVTIAMALIFSDVHTVFYAYSAILLCVILAMFLIRWFNVPIAAINPMYFI